MMFGRILKSTRTSSVASSRPHRTRVPNDRPRRGVSAGNRMGGWTLDASLGIVCAYNDPQQTTSAQLRSKGPRQLWRKIGSSTVTSNIPQ